MPRGLAILALAALPCAADPSLERWASARPHERRALAVDLARRARERGFADARPVLVRWNGGRRTLAEVWTAALAPPLGPEPPEGALETARAGLDAVGEAFAPPQPPSAGAVDLLLEYAEHAARAGGLSAADRWTLAAHAIAVAADLAARVDPGPRARWRVRERLVPAVLGGHASAPDGASRALATDAARLLFTADLADERVQARLAPLLTGRASRDVLERSYRRGALDREGLVALCRGVVAETRDDPSFAAGAPPLLLELLGEPDLPPADRGAIARAALDVLAGVAPLRDPALDLLGAAFGGPPRTLEEYRALAAKEPAPPPPEPGPVVRFLRVLLVRGERGPPAVASVLRADEPLHRAVRGPDHAFVGMLVPAAAEGAADFLGPSPVAGDRRLLRRTLAGERLAVAWHGSQGELAELCVALRDDATEPVRDGTLDEILALACLRAERTNDPEELRRLVRLLLWMEVEAARTAAIDVAARAPAACAVELLPLAERGHASASATLLRRLADLPPDARRRAVAAAVRAAGPLRDEVLALCREGDVPAAAAAASALLAHGDTRGAFALLRRRELYARAAGCSLALRLHPIAGALRVVPAEGPGAREAADALAGVFGPEDPPAWRRFGKWVEIAVRAPEEVRRLRRRHDPLYVGQSRVSGEAFARAYAKGLADGAVDDALAAQLALFLLDPADPGRGIVSEHLGPLLDALEARAGKSAAVREAWRDGLVALACAQHGMDGDEWALEMAEARLRRLAGESAPQGTTRDAGVVWPSWAASSN